MLSNTGCYTTLASSSTNT